MRGVLIAALLLCLAAPAPAEVIYVDIDAIGANDGTSWADAYVDLQDALGRAAAGDDVRVAEGVYYPAAEEIQEASFVVPNGVHLVGGFAGGALEDDEPDPSAYESTLHGFGPEGTEFTVRLVEADSTTVVSGFTVRSAAHGVLVDGGNPVLSWLLIREHAAGFAIPPHHGAGMLLLNGARPRVADTEFSNNGATRHGGAVGTPYGMSSAPSFERVIFRQNQSLDGHGGAVAAGVGTYTDVVFEGNHAGLASGAVSGGGVFRRCEFRNNWSTGFYNGGGAVGGSGFFEDVLFEGNWTAFGDGGAVEGNGTFVNVHFVGNRVEPQNLDYVPPGQGGAFSGTGTFLNCLFAGNSADAGGAVAGEVSLVQCTMSGNTAHVNGGALYAMGEASNVVNTIMWANAAAGDGAQIYFEEQSPTISHSLIQGSGGSGPGWSDLIGVDLGANLDTDPLFVDPEVGDYRLRIGSPAIDAGDTDLLPPDLLTDLDGNPRIIGAAVDMGAYEASVPGQAGLYAARFSPEVLNPTASGADVLVAVEPLWDFGVDRIDPTTLMVNGAIMPAAVKVGPRQLRLRFERDALATGIGPGRSIPVVLSGVLLDGTPFNATDELTVLDTHGPGPLRQDGPQDVPFEATLAPRFHLDAAPNPFNPSTTIRYGLAEAGPVALVIYDLAGRRVKTLVSGEIPAGEHEFIWDGRDGHGGRVASGVYLARFDTAGFSDTIRLVLLK